MSNEIEINYSIVPKLPPKFNYSELMSQLTAAHSAVGELRGFLNALPSESADLLIAPFRKKEAVTSSKIEGTNASLEEVLRYEAVEEEDVLDETTPEQVREKKIQDIIEVINYEEATEIAMRELQTRPIGENLLKTTHEMLLRSVRGDDKDRGHFRKQPVRVGKYIPPIHTDIPQLMQNWENYLNTSNMEHDPLIRIGVAHYQFEAIHPFQDGNGRLGRLIIPLFLCQEKLLPKPALYVSSYLDKHKDQYTELLHNIDVDQEWIPWLKFFLRGVELQAKDTIDVAKQMQEMYEELKDLVISNSRSPYCVQMLDLIFRTPVFSAYSVREWISAKSKGTAYALINQFIGMGILEETRSFGRERVYVFKRLWSLVNR